MNLSHAPRLLVEGDMRDKFSAIEDKQHRQFDNRFFAAICLLALAMLVNGLSSEIGQAAMRSLSDR
jgi:hypothetical protein